MNPHAVSDTQDFDGEGMQQPYSKDEILEKCKSHYGSYLQRLHMSTHRHDTSGIKLPAVDSCDNNFLDDGHDSYFADTNNSELPESDIVAPFSKLSLHRTDFPDRLELGRTLHPLVEWEGYVDHITNDSFVAKLVNVNTGTSLPEDEAIFSKSELSEYQLSHLETGAIFRWVIGMQRLPSGQKQRVSEVFFRRLPAHSEKGLKAAKENASDLIKSIDWDESS